MANFFITNVPLMSSTKISNNLFIDWSPEKNIESIFQKWNV